MMIILQYIQYMKFKVKTLFQSDLQQCRSTASSQHPSFFKRNTLGPNSNYTYKNRYQNNLTSTDQQPNSRRTIVPVQRKDLKDCLAIYQWRSKTDYPVVSSRWTGVQFDHQQGVIEDQKQIMERLQYGRGQGWQQLLVQVETEKVQVLMKYRPLLISQLLYCIKQTVVGFERLFTLFGTFQIEAGMVNVNTQGKIRIWITQSLDQNIKNLTGKWSGSEEKVVKQLKNIFQDVAADTAIVQDYFRRIDNISSFLQLLRYSQEFIEKRKIMISTSIKKQKDIVILRLLSPQCKTVQTGVPRFLSPSQPRNIKIIPNRTEFAQKYQINEMPHKMKKILANKPTIIKNIFHQMSEEGEKKDQFALVKQYKIRKQSINNISSRPSRIIQHYCNQNDFQNNQEQICQALTNKFYSESPEPNQCQLSLFAKINQLLDHSAIHHEGNSKEQHAIQLSQKPDKLKRLMNLGRQISRSIIGGQKQRC